MYLRLCLCNYIAEDFIAEIRMLCILKIFEEFLVCFKKQ